MRRRWLLVGCVAVAWLGACGAGDEPPSLACTERADLARALATAPSAVRLPDGTSISQCIERSSDPAALQNVGLVLTGLAEDLEDRADAEPAAAAQLGYLIGAARDGAGRGNGQAAELAHRLERSGAGVRAPGATAALQRAIAAGERAG